MDKNLKMGPSAEAKYEKRDPERTKSLKNGPLKMSDPQSPFLRGDPPPHSHDSQYKLTI